jgi:phage terminase large subunit
VTPKFGLKQSADLFKPAPLIGYSGGRGGAKSEDVATYLSIESNTQYAHPLLILCGREKLNSIDDSCKALIERKLRELGIISNYHITNKEIIHKTYGNKFIFKGFGLHISAVKSVDDVNICWAEEAQDLSQKTIDVLPPSIRGKGAKFICTWNPDLPSDPVERWFHERAPEGTIHHTVGWRDNRFFPDVLEVQRVALEKANKEEYLHIWEGHYKSASNQCLFTLTEIDECINRIPVKINVPKVASLDVARFGDDASVLTIKDGNHITRFQEWKKLDTVQLANAVAEIIMSESITAINIDNGGNAGGGVIDVLRRIVGGICNVLEFRGADASTMDIYTNKRTECYYKLQDWMKIGKLVDNKLLIDDLSTVLFDFNSSGQKFLLPKDKQKKLLGRSPDFSDAASMLFDPALRPRRERPQRIQRVGWDG